MSVTSPPKSEDQSGGKLLSTVGGGGFFPPRGGCNTASRAKSGVGIKLKSSNSLLKVNIMYSDLSKSLLIDS